MDVEIVELELKYCERCGGLWVRQQGSQEVYCAGCVGEMTGFPRPSRTRKRPRLPVHDKQEVRRALLCGEGGNA